MLINSERKEGIRLKKTKSLKTLTTLFAQFFILGLCTFGGGWSIVAQMQKMYVEKEKTLTQEDLLDITSVGRSLPGTMIGNVACLYGYRVAGVPGSFACILGMILPPMIILSVITFFYTKFQNNIYVARAMVGVRAAVVPIIGSALATLWKSAFKWKVCYLAALGALLLNLFWNVNCIILVLMGIVFGLVLCELKERKEASNHAAS